jgi:hypothetical protein
MAVTEYDFLGAQLTQPGGRFVTLDGRKLIVTRELRSSARTLAFVYPLNDGPIPTRRVRSSNRPPTPCPARRSCSGTRSRPCRTTRPSCL